MTDHKLSIDIEKMLADLSEISADRAIYRVHEHLRNVNKTAYEPQIIAIGPYHRGKGQLEEMEEHKKRYLEMLLKRRGETNNVVRYVTAMKKLEPRTRKCYAEPVSLNSDEFVQMMLLDGCFIIELLRKYNDQVPIGENDPIFNVSFILNSLGRDFLLAENQLPTFVLLELFKMTPIPENRNNFRQIVSHFFKETIQWYDPKAPSDEHSNTRIPHLLGLLHNDCLPPHFDLTKKENWELIRCATELQEAGIKFKKVEGGSLFDIKFENGMMKIPRLKIDDFTEALFRNLIVHEQLIISSNIEAVNYVTNYVIFMDCLINSQKDVEILCRCGIIQNWLGDDEVIASMINRLRDYVSFSRDNFYYSVLFKKVNVYCSRRRNQWLATLKHNYFNTPWALISFVAAFFLILLTVIQTVLAVLDYFKPEN